MDVNGDEVLGLPEMSQNNRALRSNPNTTGELFSYPSLSLCHKITEPYAQIPTLFDPDHSYRLDRPGVSQNNRALRSNPN